MEVTLYNHKCKLPSCLVIQLQELSVDIEVRLDLFKQIFALYQLLHDIRLQYLYPNII